MVAAGLPDEDNGIEADLVAEEVVAAEVPDLLESPASQFEAPPRGIRLFRFPRTLTARYEGLAHFEGCSCLWWWWW